MLISVIKKTLKSFPQLPLVFILLFTSVLLFTQIKIPWMLVDDGETLRMAKELSQHFTNRDFSYLFQFEAHNGRLRPVYWLFQWLTVSALGLNPFVHHFGHLVLYSLILAIFYLMVKDITKSSLAAVFSCLLFLAWGKGAENFYRVGPIEPQLALYLLATFYFFTRGNILLSLVFLPLVYFSKESAIVLVLIALSIFLLTFLQKNKKIGNLSFKKAGVFLLGNIVLAVLARLLMSYFHISGGYTEGYVLTIAQIKGGMVSYLKMINDNYGPIFIITIVLAILRFVDAYLKRIFSDRTLAWEAIFLFWFAIFLVIQSPWVFVMGRYLPPALIGLCFVMGVESAKILVFIEKQLKSRHAIYKAGFLFICLVLLLRAIIPPCREILSLQKRAVAAEAVNSEAVAFLAKNTPENGRIFYNFSDGAVELLYEMGVHFSVIYNRPDIETSYLFLEGDSDFKKGDIIVSWLPSYSRYPQESVLQHFRNLKELRNINHQWMIMRFENDETVGPLVVDQKSGYQVDKGMKLFSEGEKVRVVPMSNLLIKRGKANFLWQPPKLEKPKKISLISQKDNPLVWVEEGRIVFELFNQLQGKEESISIHQDFSSGKKYRIVLSWGPSGMTFGVNNVLKFYPYYQGLNSSDAFILGSLKSRDFQNDSGKIYDFKISTE